MTISSDETGTLFKTTEGMATFAIRKTGETQDFNYDVPFCIEFDIISFNNNEMGFFVYDGSTMIRRTFSELGITGACHLKAEYKQTGTIFSVDGNTVTTLSDYLTNTSKILFGGVDELKIKEMKIYPI